MGQRVVETAPEKSSLGLGSGGKSKEISSLAAVIDSAACAWTHVVAQGCVSLRKLVCAALDVIFGTKTNRIDENPLGVRPARLHGNIVDIGVEIIPVRIFHIFSNFSALKTGLREKKVVK